MRDTGQYQHSGRKPLKGASTRLFAVLIGQNRPIKNRGRIVLIAIASRLAGRAG